MRAERAMSQFERNMLAIQGTIAVTFMIELATLVVVMHR
jgi:hypothetical protein